VHGVIWAGDSKGYINLWNVYRERIGGLNAHDARVFKMALIGDHVWSSSEDKVKVWHRETYEMVRYMSRPMVTCLLAVQTLDGMTVWGGSAASGEVIIWPADFPPTASTTVIQPETFSIPDAPTIIELCHGGSGVVVAACGTRLHLVDAVVRDVVFSLMCDVCL
jgi:hypothetical protein